MSKEKEKKEENKALSESLISNIEISELEQSVILKKLIIKHLSNILAKESGKFDILSASYHHYKNLEKLSNSTLLSIYNIAIRRNNYVNA